MVVVKLGRMGNFGRRDTLEKGNKMSNVATKVRKFPKRGTIGNYVLLELQKNKNVDCKILKKHILKLHPDSRFNKAHLAWYKHQVKRGRYVYAK